MRIRKGSEAKRVGKRLEILAHQCVVGVVDPLVHVAHGAVVVVVGRAAAPRVGEYTRPGVVARREDALAEVVGDVQVAVRGAEVVDRELTRGQTR